MKQPIKFENQLIDIEHATKKQVQQEHWHIEGMLKSKSNQKFKFDLSPGDMLVYSGCELEHWRKPFIGEECVQVFLHYNNSTTPGSQQNMFDKRPHLGLPGSFRKCKNS